MLKEDVEEHAVEVKRRHEVNASREITKSTDLD